MMQQTDYHSLNDLQESISMKMIKRAYNTVFTPSTSIDLARIELEKSRKAFLEAKTHTEFYAAQVEFESIRIKRLEEYVNIGEPAKAMVMTNAIVAKKVALSRKVVHSVAKKRVK